MAQVLGTRICVSPGSCCEFRDAGQGRSRASRDVPAGSPPGAVNMHIIAHVPGAAEQPFDAMDETVYALVRRHGGTVSAEHGIGLKKKPYLPYARSEPELALMRRLKAALDPGNLLNPGKVL